MPVEDANYFTDNVDVTVKLVIEEGNSIIIPSGWIHAVYTPKDSIAFGGNFLHPYNFEMQLKIHGIEENLQDPLKYRFPYFEELMWYVSQHYVDLLQRASTKNKLTNWERKGLAELAEWLKFYRRKRPSTVYPSQYIIDCLHCFLKGEPLPSRTHYHEDDDNGDDGDDEGNESCICNGKADDELWIGCSTCGGWYHAGCVGLSKEEVDELDNYYCTRCLPKTSATQSGGLRKGMGSKRRGEEQNEKKTKKQKT